MSTIAIDIQTLIGSPTGVGVYTANLVTELARLEGTELFTLFCFDFKRRFAGLDIDNPRFSPRAIHSIPGRFYHLLSENLGWPDISRYAGNADLFHFPNFIIHPLRTGRAVVTIHDLSFERFPDYTEKSNLARLRTRFSYTLRRADAIIAVSRFTRNELIELHGIPAGRITVIHQGVRPPDSLIPEKSFDFPYFLFVGTIEPRKNLTTLLDAWRIATGRKGTAWRHKLVIAGSPGWRCPPAEVQVEQRGLSDSVVILDYVPNNELSSLYAGATALVYPSVYEGFGLPPLEAMACRTPVIASDAASIPEATGDAALLLPPHNAEGFADAIIRVAEDEELRRELITRGLSRASSFSWEKTARETLLLYRRVLGY